MLTDIYGYVAECGEAWDRTLRTLAPERPPDDQIAEVRQIMKDVLTMGYDVSPDVADALVEDVIR